MDDLTIRNKLEEALREPSAPPGLVERTVARAELLTRGREAERELAGGAGEERRELLAAQALLGRVMLTNRPPEGKSAQELTGELLQSERFRAAVAGRPAAELLSGMRTGRLLRSFGAAPDETAPVQTNAPAPEPPAKNVPNL